MRSSATPCRPSAPPRAPRAPAGFSCLTLWLRTLGITPHFTVPGHPEHNGRHERLHRTLERDALRPSTLSRKTFAGYTLGLDPVSPTQWDVYLAEYLLGAMDLTTLRFQTLTQRLTSPITPV